MEIIEWIRSLPAWFLSVIEPLYFGLGLDAWLSLQQFLFLVAVALVVLVLAILNYFDRRD